MKTFGINGFGRIGRTAFRVWWLSHTKELTLKVVNTSGSMELADWVHLLKYDSNYGLFDQEITFQQQQSKKEVTDDNPVLGTITIGNHQIVVTAQKDPAKIPWGKYEVDIVVESTGIFTSADKAQAHLQAGAKKVIISAPPKGGGIQTLVLGVNEHNDTSRVAPSSAKPSPELSSNQHSLANGQVELKSFVARIRAKYRGETLRPVVPQPSPTTPQPTTSSESTAIISNASCTTNCVAPVAQIMVEQFGVKKAMLTTIHSYTDDQNLHDNSHKDLRRARAAALNIVPTTTGAAVSATEVVPELKGLFDGLAIRVPTPVGSLSDMVFLVNRPVTKEEVNQSFIDAAREERWQGILAVTDEPIVSSDIKGRSESSIVDLSLTQVIDGDLVKVVSWYDNEWGYCNRLVEQVAFV